MKHTTRIFIGVAVSVLAIAAASWSQPDKPVVLPTLLDNFYPPNSPAPVYLINMIQLVTPLSGTVSDFMQKDSDNVGQTFAKFRAKYVEVAKLVPDWESLFPIEPVDELGAALNTNDPVKVMAAADKVGQICHDCHVMTLAAVQQRYGWGDFGNIAATDPLSKQTVSFLGLMQMIDGSFSGMETDLEQGQIENARANVAGFKARMGELRETCQACHATERKYFVDDGITARIDQLAAALETTPIDNKAVGGLIQDIGMESCHQCHLVHSPAALSPYRFGAQTSH